MARFLSFDRRSTLIQYGTLLFFETSGRYIPEEGKNNEENLKFGVGTNPGGRKTKKPSCKSTALDGD